MERIEPGGRCPARVVVEGEPNHADFDWDMIPNAGDAAIWRNPGEDGRRYLEVRCAMCGETHSVAIDPFGSKLGWRLVTRNPLTMLPSVKVGPTYDGYVCHYTITDGIFNAHADSKPRPPRGT
jgi:hypothetical protein